MAGHSHFKNMMHRKGAQDAKKAKIFARLSREIIIAAQTGIDPEKNPRLRAALSLARSANMPKDKIQNAIEKASGSSKDNDLAEVRYEGYGPGGTAIIVEGLTDNKNRTAPEIRSIFTKFGGNLGEIGSVSYLFEHRGFIIYPKEVPIDKIFDIATQCGAKDIIEDTETTQIITDLENFGTVRDQCLNALGDPIDHGFEWIPLSTISITEDKIETFEKLLDSLENNDDVQNVYTNICKNNENT